MADYHPLITRAVEGLSENTPDLRQAVYERARAALLHQLRSLDPPLSEADITRERLSLDEAIDRVEREQGARRMPPPPRPAARPAPPPPAPPPVERQAAAAAHAEASWPEPARAEAAATEPAPAEIKPPLPPSLPRRMPPAPALRGSFEPDEAPEAAPEPRPAPEVARERPRIGTVGPAVAGSGRGRSIVLASVLAAVIGSIALAAWLLRDKPPELPRQDVVGGPVRPPEPESKFGERVTGERAPAPPAAPAGAPAAPAPAAPAPPAAPAAAPPRADVGIAQRAILYEENPADPQTPRATPARVVWRLDALNVGQGQPLETVVRATIETEGGLTLNLLLRRNLDAALPASHTIELAFGSGGKDPSRVVRDVGKLALKNEEGLPGAPLAGLQVPVTTNLFLFGLSNVPRDIERNTELLLRRNWIDLPIMFTSGQRAVLSFEKGIPGESVLNEAFRQW